MTQTPDLTADFTFTDTTDSSGNWTTDTNDLTVTRLAALESGDLTITASATGAASGTRTVTYDRTIPTIVSAAAPTDTTITVTMSENVYAATAPDAADFTITRSGGNAPTVSAITGIPSAIGSADSAFTLTLGAAIASGDTLSYTQNGTNAKIPQDPAGNTLATVTGVAVTITPKTVAISDVSTDNYINDAEDESAVLIAGTSTGLPSGTSISITIDDTDTDTNADYSFTAATNASGAWTTASTDLTSARIKALDEGGLTITASATGVTDATKVVSYDTTAPTLSFAAYGSTKLAVTMTEIVYASTAPAVTDFKVKSGTAGSETENIVTGIAGLANTVGGAGDTITLTLTSTVSAGNSVLAYYTKGTNTITDVAGNTMASVAEDDAVSASQGARVSFVPADGGYLVSLSGNSLVGFSSAIYSDSSCATASDQCHRGEFGFV